MTIPRFLIKIYHLIPFSGKERLRSLFYFVVVPVVRIKRSIFLHKKLDIGPINGVTYKNFIGIAECHYKNELFFITYPLVQSSAALLDEIFNNNPYFTHCFINKGDIVIDCGAHIGFFSIIAGNLTGNHGKVIAIEADPFNLEFLKLNRKINNNDNVSIIAKAVFSKKEKVNFYVNDLCSAASGLYSGHNKKIKVEADSIDNIIKDAHIDETANIFLKMDIEGAEIEAIEGMKKALNFPNIKGVIAAYHKIPPNMQRTYITIEPILKSYGFKVINKDGFLHFWRE